MPDAREKAEAVSIERVAHCVGHELRNPLAVMNNSIYFVKTKLGASAEAKVAKHIGIIESEIRRADAIINQIVAYARPPAPVVAPGSLNALVEERLAARKVPEGVGLETALAPGGPRAAMDAKAVGAALDALLDNALEAASPSGTVRVLTKTEADGRALLEVSDTGPGFPAEILREPGAPFLTTKPRGVGLGLALARKTAERLGGSLEIANTPGGGALQRLRLPGAKD